MRPPRRPESGLRGRIRAWLRGLRLGFGALLPARLPPLDPLPEPVPGAAAGPRILVLCHDVVRRGGLLRFARVARALRPQGAVFVLASIARQPQVQAELDMPLLPLDAALRRRWDAVMVPGAGFADDGFGRLALFRDDRFGVRIQHVLNDRSLLARFLDVNRAFAPHAVVFNTLDWTPGSYTGFSAERFHVLCGAVDVPTFASAIPPALPRAPGRFVVGGLASKNPLPLVEMLRTAPADVRVRLFGPDIIDVALQAADLLAEGRLELLGPLPEAALPAFYATLDCVVATETSAGWANLAAEAMASGLPVICTRAGTQAFAEDGRNALVIEAPSAAAVGAAVARLRGDPALARRLGEAGRAAIGTFSWERYGERLLALLPRDGRVHHYHAPDLGAFGPWPAGPTLEALEPVLAGIAGLSVVELRCREGLVARACLARGAAAVRAVDPDAATIAAAAAHPGPAFAAGDVAEAAGPADLLLDVAPGVPEIDAARLEAIVAMLPAVRRAAVLRLAPGVRMRRRADRLMAAAGFVPDGSPGLPCWRRPG